MEDTLSQTDIDSIIGAARQEPEKLITQEEEKPSNNNDINNNNNPTSENNFDFKKMLDNKVGDIVNKISEGGGIEDFINKIPPDMVQQAKKLISNGQADKVVKEMQKRGMDPRTMKQQLNDYKKMANLTGKSSISNDKYVIKITQNRQLKTKKISKTSVQFEINKILQSSNVKQQLCPSLSIGPFVDKKIFIWYSDDNKIKNRRASKILGTSVSGDVVFICDDCDLPEKDFLAAEKLSLSP